VTQRVYGPDNKLIGSVEYKPDRDRFEASTLPLTVGGTSIFYDCDEAVRWVRDQHAEHADTGP
jgi:hypothetical protein